MNAHGRLFKVRKKEEKKEKREKGNTVLLLFIPPVESDLSGNERRRLRSH